MESEVLLLYVYASTHPYAVGNLKYFIENAVHEDDGVDYYFILQQIDNKPIDEKEMPQLKSRNAHYIQHENKCFDFGTYGWFFNEFTFGNPWTNQKQQSTKINIKKYKYFIFINSSVRGPFFPPYFIDLVLNSKKNYHWYSIFTRRIDEKVKLVGCTINCEQAPHVQGYFFVTDFVGLTVLLKPGAASGTLEEGIFACYPTKDHAILNGEIPTSNRILDAGYMIDSLLTKYQKVNFSDPINRSCNGIKNPYFNAGFEGTTLEPFEVVFVKYGDLSYAYQSRDRAKLYEKWTQDAKSINRTSW